MNARRGASTGEAARGRPARRRLLVRAGLLFLLLSSLSVGGLQLAMAVLLIAAFLRLTRTLVLVAALSSVAWQAPHAVYHLLHASDLPTPADRVVQSVLLLISLAVAAGLLVAALRLNAVGDAPRKP